MILQHLTRRKKNGTQKQTLIYHHSRVIKVYLLFCGTVWGQTANQAWVYFSWAAATHPTGIRQRSLPLSFHLAIVDFLMLHILNKRDLVCLLYFSSLFPVTHQRHCNPLSVVMANLDHLSFVFLWWWWRKKKESNDDVSTSHVIFCAVVDLTPARFYLSVYRTLSKHIGNFLRPTL